MGKKYYCDYCDRSFKDTIDARKKHLASLQHTNNFMNHYKPYKDPETILKEESGKIPCKKFMNNECIFGESCRFSHYTPQMIMQLHHLVATKQQLKQAPRMPDPEEIIQEFFQDQTDSKTIHETNYPQWTYPSELLNCANLPPSLWPISYTSINSSNFASWGK